MNDSERFRSTVFSIIKSVVEDKETFVYLLSQLYTKEQIIEYLTRSK